MRKEEIDSILTKHAAWLAGESSGEMADLRGAYLIGANLREADLSEAKTYHRTTGFHLACPEEGSFVAWKKAGGKMVKLLIPEDAKRSSATTLKCRASKVVVLEIEGGDVATSERGATYRVGETVYPDSFDDNRWNECSHGIHFFMSKACAMSW